MASLRGGIPNSPLILGSETFDGTVLRNPVPGGGCIALMKSFCCSQPKTGGNLCAARCLGTNREVYHIFLKNVSALDCVMRYLGHLMFGSRHAVKKTALLC